MGANPAVNTLAETAPLSTYLKPVDPVSGFPTANYIYDNDGDIEAFSACGQTLDGINVRITNLDQSIVQKVDDAIDDGNLSCGQVRWIPSGSMLKYILSDTQTLS